MIQHKYMIFKNKISQKVFLPVMVIVGLMLLWEIMVISQNIPAYILPKPSFIIETLIIDWPILYPSMINTIKITLGGFIIATFGGVAIAILTVSPSQLINPISKSVIQIMFIFFIF